MYTPPQFEIQELAELHAMMQRCGLAQFVTATSEGILCTPLPLVIDTADGEFGTLHGHLARANPQWKLAATHDALAIFPGLDAYITPSWYATKAETGKVVPTWNYETIHAYGVPEFYDDPERLLDVVTRLTRHHEESRPAPWQVGDAPPEFLQGQLRGIVGIRMPIRRLEGKRKMSQNRPAADRAGVVQGLSDSSSERDRAVAEMVRQKGR